MKDPIIYVLYIRFVVCFLKICFCACPCILNSNVKKKQVINTVVVILYINFQETHFGNIKSI